MIDIDVYTPKPGGQLWAVGTGGNTATVTPELAALSAAHEAQHVEHSKLVAKIIGDKMPKIKCCYSGFSIGWGGIKPAGKKQSAELCRKKSIVLATWLQGVLTDKNNAVGAQFHQQVHENAQQAMDPAALQALSGPFMAGLSGSVSADPWTCDNSL